MYLKTQFGIDELALIIFEYGNIEFCCQHLTHYPKIMRCIQCAKVPTPLTDQVIYHFKKPIIKKRRKTEVTFADRFFLQIDFHEDDYDFKHHLLETIASSAHISYYDNLESDNKDWWFIWVANCRGNKQYEIRNCLKHACDSTTFTESQIYLSR